MAISWGGFTNHLRIGIDVWTDGYDSYTPSINVYVAYYVGVDSSWNFDDQQTLVLGGNAVGSWGFHNGMGANGVKHIGTYTVGGQGQSYGGGPTYTFTGRLDGVYLGAGPTHSVNFSLPPRPIRPPAPPGVPFYTNITATSALPDFTGSPDHGGSTVDAYDYHIATDAGFGNTIRMTRHPATATGLTPGTTYYGRSYAHNAAGWSAPSAGSSFTTSALATGTPTVSSINPDSATISWTAPTDGTPTQYNLQLATNAQFTSPAKDVTNAWALSYQATGLQPATTYYARVRANTGSGFGAWSPTATFATLSGAKIRVSGAWVNGTAYVRSGGAWVLAKVHKRLAGAWVL